MSLKEIGAPDKRIKRFNELVLTPWDFKSLAQLFEHRIITEVVDIQHLSIASQKNLT